MGKKNRRGRKQKKTRDLLLLNKKNEITERKENNNNNNEDDDDNNHDTNNKIESNEKIITSKKQPNNDNNDDDATTLNETTTEMNEKKEEEKDNINTESNDKENMDDETNGNDDEEMEEEMDNKDNGEDEKEKDIKGDDEDEGEEEEHEKDEDEEEQEEEEEEENEKEEENKMEEEGENKMEEEEEGQDDEDNDAQGEDDDDDDEEDDDDDDEEEEEEEDEESPNEKDITIHTDEEHCTLDLRNLVALNSHQVDSNALYNTTKTPKPNPTTIQTNAALNIDENHLLKLAKDGCQQLFTGLWSLEMEETDVGSLAKLPPFFIIRTPRALPPPKPKKETKWEKFAKERGILSNTTRKRSQKVWDEATQTWKFRHGYQKANDDSHKDWPIMEVKMGDDPYANPWEKARTAKKLRIEKNTQNHMRNMERAGSLPKGSTTRFIKNRAAARKNSNNNNNNNKPIPSGVPVDIKSSSHKNSIGEIQTIEQNPIKRGKALTKAALIATQRSTASLGKFDPMREGEPERKKIDHMLKKRKFESSVGKEVVRKETDRTMKVFNKVMKGGGGSSAKAKEKAIRRGDLAKGETAYDYEFNDGLGPSTFRKKKGRGGVGKMKKITKKRAS